MESTSARSEHYAQHDDRALMQAHKDGDPEAFGEIVHRHQDRLWAIAMRTLTDPHDRMDERLISLEGRQALSKIPEDQRAAVVAVDILGYSIDDASELLGIPPGTVKSRCFRGRARLLPLLAHLRNPEPEPSVLEEPSIDPQLPVGGDSTHD